MEFRIRAWAELDDELAHEGLTRFFGIGDERIVAGPDASPTTRKQFLRTVIGVAEGTELTPRGVIPCYTHVEGGVHFGASKDPGESTLSRMSPTLLGHSTGQVQVLAHLGRIVAEALEPLRSAILSEPTIHRPLHLKNDRDLFLNHWTTDYFDRHGGPQAAQYAPP